MIIGHLADLHISGRHPFYTLNDQVRTIERYATDFAADHVSHIVIAGDLFHSPRSTAMEREALADAIRALSDVASVDIVYGNHDGKMELHYLTRMSAQFHVGVHSAPSVLRPRNLVPMIALIPWPRRSSIEPLRTLLGSIAVQFATHNGPRLILAHLEMGAAKADDGSPAVRDCRLDVCYEDLMDTGATYCALGHAHTAQEIGPGCRYAGTPWQTRWGEHSAGCDIVNLETRHTERLRCALPPMVTVDLGASIADRDPKTLSDLCLADKRHLRLSYATDTERAAMDSACASELRDRLLDNGDALTVTLHPIVTPLHRARSSAIVTAATHADRLRAYYESVGGEPTDGMMSKLSSAEDATDAR